MAKLIGTGTNQVPTNGMLGGMAFQSPEDVTVKKIQEEGYNVVTQTDIGTAPNQIPLNQFLGGLAYMDSVAGLDFSATSSASTGTVTSQILDDYEEGTFSPTYSDASGNSSTTVTGVFGQYVKVGRMVSCYGSFFQAGSPTGMVGTDELRITGLPFTSSATAQNVGNITSLYSAYRQPTVRFTRIRLSSNSNYLVVLRDNGSPNLTSGTANWEVPALVDSIDSVGANNCAVSFNITYHID
jgi:hypothetical protein